MLKPTHKSVTFTAAEMAEDAPPDTDFSKMRYLGRGRAALDLAPYQPGPRRRKT